MQPYTDILFDLDGTLTDSAPGILRCFRLGMESQLVPCPPDEVLRGEIIGPPIDVSFAHFGVPAQQISDAVAAFRKQYSLDGWSDNRVYDGIPALLACLRDAGLHLSVATSKPEHFARRILEHFDLTSYFTHICGARPEEGISTKEDVLALALSQVPPSGRALMVGDRKHDMLGARFHGIDAAGVLFGFGSRAELEAYHPVFLAERPADLAGFLLSGRGIN